MRTRHSRRWHSRRCPWHSLLLRHTWHAAWHRTARGSQRPARGARLLHHLHLAHHGVERPRLRSLHAHRHARPHSRRLRWELRASCTRRWCTALRCRARGFGIVSWCWSRGRRRWRHADRAWWSLPAWRAWPTKARRVPRRRPRRMCRSSWRSALKHSGSLWIPKGLRHLGRRPSVSVHRRLAEDSRWRWHGTHGTRPHRCSSCLRRPWWRWRRVFWLVWEILLLAVFILVTCIAVHRFEARQEISIVMQEHLGGHWHLGLLRFLVFLLLLLGFLVLCALLIRLVGSIRFRFLVGSSYCRGYSLRRRLTHREAGHAKRLCNFRWLPIS